MSMEEGYIERWSGRLVRGIAFYVFLLGILGLVLLVGTVLLGVGGDVEGTLGATFWGVVMLLPYTAIKARDRYPRLQVLR